MKDVRYVETRFKDHYRCIWAFTDEDVLNRDLERFGYKKDVKKIPVGEADAKKTGLWGKNDFRIWVEKELGSVYSFNLGKIPESANMKI